MFIFGLITGAVIVAIIMYCHMTAKIDKTNAQSQQEMQTHHESELAAKDAEIADCKTLISNLNKSVAYYENIQKSSASRWQQLSDRERKVDERERDLESRKRELEQRWQSFPKEAEEIIARRVAADIKGKQKGIDENWHIIKREKRTLLANNEKYNEKSARLDEREQKMYERAVLIADHLGVPLRCILNRREKKLVDQLANELTEERYALMDLVVSCPDDQAKDLLKWMQQFPRS